MHFLPTIKNKVATALLALALITINVTAMTVQQRSIDKYQAPKKGYSRQKLYASVYNSLAQMPNELIKLIVDYSFSRQGTRIQGIKILPYAITSIVVVNPTQIAIGSHDTNILLLSLTSDQHLALEGHKDAVNCLAMSAPNTLASGSDDTNINLWDTQTGRKKASLEDHLAPVTALITYNGNLISGSKDCTIRKWDGTTGKPLGIMYNWDNPITAIVRLPNDQAAVLLGNNSVCICNINNIRKPKFITVWGAQHIAFVGPTTLAIGSSEAINQHGYGSMAKNKGNTITLIDTNTERATALMKEHKAPVKCLTSITNTGLILSGSNDNTIRIWNPQNNQCLATIKHPAKPTCIVPLSDDYAAIGDERGYFSIIILTN